MTYARALAALADPTRRQLFEKVRSRDFTVGELAIVLEITQPAVSQHLRVLREASLVIHRCDGQRRYYRHDPRGLAALREYLEGLWGEALAAYANPHDDTNKTGIKKKVKS